MISPRKKTLYLESIHAEFLLILIPIHVCVFWFRNHIFIQVGKTSDSAFFAFVSSLLDLQFYAKSMYE